MNELTKSIESEKAILSRVLNGCDFTEVELRPGDFYSQANKAIFEAMTDLDRKGVPVDLPAVVGQLRETGKLEIAGGAVGLSRLMDEHPLAVSIKHHSEIIRDRSIRRQVIFQANALIQNAHTYESAQALIDAAQSRFMSIDSSNGSEAITIGDACVEAVEAIEQAQSKGGSIGIKTGFRAIDDALGGLYRGEMNILAARPSMGKTALAQQIAENAANMGRRVAFFSLEQSRRSLCFRSINRRTGIPYVHLLNGKVQKSDYNEITAAADKISNLPLIIDDRGALHVHEIIRQCRRLKKNGGIDLAVVDYLQLSHGDKSERKDIEVGQISSALKAAAKELQITVLALSQLNRMVEGRKDKRPILADLRESGSLEQDADVVLFLFNSNRYENGSKRIDENKSAVEAELIIAKARNGRTGIRRVTWCGWRMAFEDPVQGQRQKFVSAFAGS